MKNNQSSQLNNCCVRFAQIAVKLVARKAKHWLSKAGASYRLGLRVFIAGLISLIEVYGVGSKELGQCLWLLAPIVREAISAFHVRLGSAESDGDVLPPRNSNRRLLHRLVFLSIKMLYAYFDLNIKCINEDVRIAMIIIRICRVAQLFIVRFAQIAVKLVARKAKHWQAKAGASYRLGLRVFIAGLISLIEVYGVGSKNFRSYVRG